jgi:hypothetical protein
MPVVRLIHAQPGTASVMTKRAMAPVVEMALIVPEPDRGFGELVLINEH